ncbi:MAG: T9SS type A sorting domain-containing protein [Flavipsychrobacter sp.]
MKKLLLLSCITLFSFGAAQAQWTTLSTDASGDGANSSYLDGTKLEYRYDDMTDSVWFRVTVSQYKAYAFGINIILDVTGAGSKGTWWGNQNSSFQYNRLITAWMSNPPMGTVGITDAAGAASSNYTKIAGANKITIVGNTTDKTYTLGMKRTDIYNGASLNAKVIAAVGAHNGWNDDLPNTGSGSINLTPNTTAVHHLSKEKHQFSIHPNPSNGVFSLVQNSNNESQITVYNITGIKVFETTTKQKETNIDLSSLSSGTYVIKLTNNGTTSAQQITIQ